MNKYAYNGPVMEFDICIMNHWRGETMAISEAKARSNLAYQFKKQYNRLASSKISLPGDISVVRKGDIYGQLQIELV